MGYWVDLDNPYVTFENNYIESLWWILKQFYTKNLLYESVSIQPYSPAAGTGLSSHELNQPGTYKDVKDTSAVAMFALTLKGTNTTHPFAETLLKLGEEAWKGSNQVPLQGRLLHGLDNHTLDFTFKSWFNCCKTLIMFW
jgi:leucyl-tRNA synthetase